MQPVQKLDHSASVLGEAWTGNEEDDDELKSPEVTEAQMKASDLRNVEHITVFLCMLKLSDLLAHASRLPITSYFQISMGIH